MPKQETTLTDQEKQIVKEVQTLLGLASIEETLEYLAKQRIKELLCKIAGQEIKRNSRHLF